MNNEERFEEILRKVIGSQEESKPTNEKEQMQKMAQLFYDVFTSLVSVGFNEEQALDILLTMIANNIG